MNPPTMQLFKGSFEDDIIDLFKDENGNEQFFIPKYVIVNKKGEIVEKVAARPSNPIALKGQLEKYL
jgi:hypothetical protein